MYYLDQDIDVAVSFPTSATDRTVTYKVKEIGSSGAVYNRFAGNCFIPKGQTAHTFHLNDIIEDWKYKNDLSGTKTVVPPVNWIGKWKVTITIGNIDYSSEVIDVAMIYRYPNRKKTVAPELNNFYEAGNGIIIRQGVPSTNNSEDYKCIPHIPYIQSDTFIFSAFIDFQYAGGTLVPGISSDADILGTTKITFTDNYGVVNLSLKQWFAGLDFRSVPERDLNLFTGEEVDWFGTVAEVDVCPAKYYLLWQDRYGSMQSQPFTGTETYSEAVTQTISMDYKGHKNLIGVDVQPKWKLNSGWISEELYPYYESMFTSPYIKLYVTDNTTTLDRGLMIDVCLTDSEYTEKTFKNQGKKMFNLEVNIEQNKQQNIKY